MIELLVVVGLIAIVITLALPYFSALIDRWRVYQGVTALQNVMRFARAQAIRTNSNVFIQAKSTSCRSLPEDTHNWSCGLTVFQDVNPNKGQDPDDPTLQDLPEFHALTVMYGPGIGSSARFSYGPHGAPSTNSSFQVYPTGNSNSRSARVICQSSGGRLRVTEDPKCSELNR